MNKIVVAPDSFKGSLTANEVAISIEEGIKSVFPQCEVLKVPIADGGEGTVDALVAGTGGKIVTATVAGPLMRPVEARYGIIDEGSTAIIEMAEASGLTLISSEERNPMETTTYGTGELIRDAILRGCRRFLVGIGGSATNDAGTGMLQALGFRFFDEKNRELGKGGKILDQIARIDSSDVIPELKGCDFIVACDVSNPFYGPQGAAYVYAPQKGADEAMVRDLDAGLKHFAQIIRKFTGKEVCDIPGAGAAGGLGGALLAFVGAELTPGIRMVLKAVSFEDKLNGAELVITGEGRLDSQTTMGKAPQGVLDIALSKGIPVIAIGGAVEDAAALNAAGFSAVFPIIQGVVDLKTAMKRTVAAENIHRTISQIMRLIQQIK